MEQNISKKDETLALLTDVIKTLSESIYETDTNGKCEIGRTIGELSKIIIREENIKENPNRYPFANLPL